MKTRKTSHRRNDTGGKATSVAISTSSLPPDWSLKMFSYWYSPVVIVTVFTKERAGEENGVCFGGKWRRYRRREMRELQHSC